MVQPVITQDKENILALVNQDGKDKIVKFELPTNVNISLALMGGHARDLELTIINVFVQPDFKGNIVKNKHKHVQITLAKMVQPVLTTPTSWEEVS